MEFIFKIVFKMPYSSAFAFKFYYNLVLNSALNLLHKTHKHNHRGLSPTSMICKPLRLSPIAQQRQHQGRARAAHLQQGERRFEPREVVELRRGRVRLGEGLEVILELVLVQDLTEVVAGGKVVHKRRFLCA